MGRASGWHGLIGNQDNYRRVTYTALAALTRADRVAQVRQVCQVAGVRMPDKKAVCILGCFDYVTRLGGPEAAKASLLAQPGREAKIAFLQSFPGIGPKYARNIMMDLYHRGLQGQHRPGRPDQGNLGGTGPVVRVLSRRRAVLPRRGAGGGPERVGAGPPAVQLPSGGRSAAWRQPGGAGPGAAPDCGGTGRL